MAKLPNRTPKVKPPLSDFPVAAPASVSKPRSNLPALFCGFTSRNCRIRRGGIGTQETTEVEVVVSGVPGARRRADRSQSQLVLSRLGKHSLPHLDDHHSAAVGTRAASGADSEAESGAGTANHEPEPGTGTDSGSGSHAREAKLSRENRPGCGRDIHRSNRSQPRPPNSSSGYQTDSRPAHSAQRSTTHRFRHRPRIAAAAPDYCSGSTLVTTSRAGSRPAPTRWHRCSDSTR